MIDRARTYTFPLSPGEDASPAVVAVGTEAAAADAADAAVAATSEKSNLVIRLHTRPKPLLTHL